MDNGTAFSELTRLFEALEATTKRTEKKELISSFLQRLREEEVQPVISFLLGRAFPQSDDRTLDFGVRTLYSVVEGAKQSLLDEERLTILRVRRVFDEVSRTSGRGSRRRKQRLVRSLLSQATPVEREYLKRIILGEMRIGVVDGVTLEAVSQASGSELGLVRRAYMLMGSLEEVTSLALKCGKEGLRGVGLSLFTPIRPMLAEMAYDLEEVLTAHGGVTGLEYKFDGARVQIHLKGDEVKVYSRSLTDVTQSVPEIVEAVEGGVEVEAALLDGEAVAYGDRGKPLPFQDLMKRFRRIHGVENMREDVPVRLYLFDVLYMNGKLLIDESYEERLKTLSMISDPSLLTSRIIVKSVSEAEDFLQSALSLGHEGLIAKALNSEYTPGTRGKRWFKIKPVKTLDLTIMAADWGYGRRKGWLSNYHLAARDMVSGEYLCVGKTFKGLTDDEFEKITRRLMEVKMVERGSTVHVKPEIVVEVAFNEIQRSYKYRSGFALRFARIIRIRSDKSPLDVDSIGRVREMFEKQFKYKSEWGFKTKSKHQLDELK